MSLRRVNDLYVTESICYPRSGHQMLLDILQEYFGKRLVYCEIYKDGEHAIDVDEHTNYQKNHDFDLNTFIKGDRKYLVQVRDPLDSLASRWEMQTREGSVTDGEEDWRRSMKEWAIFWSGFVNKWVFSPVPNRLIVRYEDLLNNPMDTAANAIQFIEGRPNTDIPKLRATLDRFPMRQRTRKPLMHCHLA